METGPVEQVLEAERSGGISRHDLRPDIYSPPRKPTRKHAHHLLLSPERRSRSGNRAIRTFAPITSSRPDDTT